MFLYDKRWILFYNCAYKIRKQYLQCYFGYKYQKLISQYDFEQNNINYGHLNGRNSIMLPVQDI